MSLRLVVSFFALDREAAPKVKSKKKKPYFSVAPKNSR
jgi:hypothetical protein